MYQFYLKIVLDVLLIYFVYVTDAQNCDFDGACKWKVKSGFVKENSETPGANKDIISSYDQLQRKTGNFLVCRSGADAKCSIQSDIVEPKPSTESVCISAGVFIGHVSKGTPTFSSSPIEVSLVNNISESQTRIVETITLEKEKWIVFSANFTRPNVEFRLRINVNLSDNSTFLILDNIRVDNCSNDRCGANDEFVCGDGSCIKWDRVCNLEKNCPSGRDEETELCGIMPTGSMCTFENGTCGWTHSKKSKMFWTLHHGPSETDETGPSKDHTLGTNKGHYLYIETSNQPMGSSAILESMVLPAVRNGRACKIRFFYHMMGKTLGKLEVYLIDVCRPRRMKRKMFYDHNNHGDKWMYAELTVTNISWYQISIHGICGLSNHGDIALDDISLSPECYGIQHNKTNLLADTIQNNTVSIAEFRKRRMCQRANVSNNPPTVYSPPINLTTEPVTDVQPVPTLQHQQPFNINIEYIIVITAVLALLILGSTLLCFGIRKRKKQSRQSARLEMASNASEENCRTLPVQASSFDMQLRCAVTELNPNYDFITAKYPEQHLREIPRQSLTLLRLLGQGAFGEVYEGVLKNLCANVMELPVAVKTLPALSSEQAETDFLMEAVIISKFMHKNVVKCLGVCFEEHPRYIVLELLPGGDLRSYLRDSRPKANQPCQTTMEDLVRLALDIANGCRHLEEKHFVHRDVAARNCLLTTREPGRIAKIADFGMSRDIYSADYYRKDGKAMLPIKWMPPEAFLDGVFTSKTDVWSFGILLWEIYTLGYMPYPGQTNSDVMHFVASGGRLDPPQNCPARLNKIMLMCWNSVADIRPAFSEIIDHLDMCLQDPEVMGCDMSVCHYPLAECLKDVSILVKSVTTDTSTEGDTSNIPSVETTADYGGHVASQSREPLLPSADEVC